MAAKSNSHGKGKKLVSCTIPIEMYDKLLQLAEVSGLTISNYARKSIIRTVQANIRFQEIEHGTTQNPITVGNPIAHLPPVISLRAAEDPGTYQTGKNAKKAG